MKLINNYDLNDSQVVQNLVKENTLGRNKHIANIMRIFNSDEVHAEQLQFIDLLYYIT